MSDFNWFLNKQGLRGLTGEKGEQGFSPIIDVIEDTIESYKLRITTEDNEIETPNLKGSVSIQDQGGTYVRYDRETGELTANEADRASKESYGVVRLSKIEDLDVEELQDTVAMSVDVTKSLVSDSIHAETVERINADASIRQSISTLSNSLQSTNTRVTNITNDLATEKQVRLAADTQQQAQIDAERQEREVQDASLQNQLNTKLTADNIKQGENITITRDGNNITINSSGGGGAGDVTAAGNNIFTGTNTFTNTINIGDRFNHIQSYITYDNNTGSVIFSEIGPFANLSLDTVGSFYERRFIGGRVGVSPVLAQADVDNQTIKVVDGVLHADFSEIGDEVNTLAGRMNTVENELGDLTERVDDLSLFKFPNATIIGTPTINNGQISNFSAANYLQFPFEFETKGRTWLLNGSFHTGNDVTTQQNIIDSLASVALAVRSGRLVMALSTNGTSFDLGEHISMSDIDPNTDYYFRISFSGTQYLLSLSTDKIDFMPEAIVTSSSPIASRPMTISSSGHPYGSTINLNDWNLTVANTLVWQGMDDVGIASRVDVNATNFTETGKENIRDIAGVGQIEEALDLLNGADTTLLSTKADISFSNINDDAKQVIKDAVSPDINEKTDGPWIVNNIDFITANTTLTANTTTTFDVSDAIPNDGHQYTLIINGVGQTGSTSGDAAEIIVGTDLSDGNCRLAKAQTRSASSVYWGGTTILPVGEGRRVTIKQNGSMDAVCRFFRVIAYRRCGLNS